MKKIFLILINVLCMLPSFGQDTEEYIVTYVDSIPSNASYKMTRNRQNVQKAEANTLRLYSREKKIIVEYTDDDFMMTTGILRCMKMAIDTWESKIIIKYPFIIKLEISENLNPNIEIQTNVLYSYANREAVPSSLYYQEYKYSTNNISGTIVLNANIEWNYSWADDEGMSGTDNLTTALLRHVAHILGFGSTEVKLGDQYGFIPYVTSKFDKMVSNGQQTLASLAFNGNNDDFENFFKSDLYLQLPNNRYPLYSSPTGYVQYRTGKYFSLKKNNIMNYPYGDKTELQGINEETLEVMEAIGWSVNPYDVKITSLDVDINGYGSIYLPMTFNAYDSDNNIIRNATWTYQLYNGKEYIDKQSISGSSFTIMPDIETGEYNDEFVFQQARIICSVEKNGKTERYNYPLYLELKPLFIDYEISNIKENYDSRYYSYDIKLRHIGVNNGVVFVCNDGGETINHRIKNEYETQIHVSKAYKYGTSYLDITLNNQYGSTGRFLYINTDLFKNNISTNSTVKMNPVDLNSGDFDVYTIHGIKLKNVTDINSLPKGEYIIKNNKHQWQGEKYIIK